MKRILCPQLPKPNRPVHLPESEANHAVRVLRLRDGDTVEAMDGQGHSAPAILRVHGGPPRLEFAGGETHAHTAKPGSSATPAIVPVTLEIGILKGDAMEWVVEKAVELGVRRLAPAITAHTVVQIKSKGPEAFRERWQKIADQALKQCGRLERLEIDPPRKLEELLARSPADAASPRLWCDEAASPTDLDLLTALLPPSAEAGMKAAAIRELRLLIGPEGGWSEEERGLLGASARKVTLGPLVLRAETAAVYGMSLAAAAFRAPNRLT